jgi:hypothetical protein
MEGVVSGSVNPTDDSALAAGATVGPVECGQESPEQVAIGGMGKR